ncbi:cysteine desulfurase family protein [Halalkalibacter akibai]|uniref:cysteine desulfurase n=1 Tax=Halalkalibacter akibai (strain ATCC 43226 / DSM 21942 / CIP 109018 / JCM 9157 / 1139) TaxID=1236973 RepID=W4QYZ6_HALA3|nr:cysteine desulfurase family protein [Halalkalibacter akibai]GAE36514.1 cysteine desulfurase [Halalkalibacter akibai JCM 9157]
MKQIYLDYNASTPLAPEVVEVMTPFLTKYYGNPSTTHFAAIEAKKAVEKARQQVASFIGAAKEEIIFTSGGTESNNHVIRKVFDQHHHKGKHFITTAIEHPAVHKPLEYLKQFGAEITYLPVDKYGQVSIDSLKKAIRSDTILITIMHANNEVGTIQPIEKIGEIAKQHGVLFHTDAAQSLGKIEVDVIKQQVDFLSIAGHKLYAPKGIGALYIRKGVELKPYLLGAGHENGLRAGTENVMFIAGLGEACETAKKFLIDMSKTKQLKEEFLSLLRDYFPNQITVNGHPVECLPNTLNISFKNRIGQDILTAVPEIAASTGSACHSGVVTLSPVLKAMGVMPEEGKGTIRFSLGRFTTDAEIKFAAQYLKVRLA